MHPKQERPEPRAMPPLSPLRPPPGPTLPLMRLPLPVATPRRAARGRMLVPALARLRQWRWRLRLLPRPLSRRQRTLWRPGGAGLRVWATTSWRQCCAACGATRGSAGGSWRWCGRCWPGAACSRCCQRVGGGEDEVRDGAELGSGHPGLTLLGLVACTVQCCRCIWVKTSEYMRYYGPHCHEHQVPVRYCAQVPARASRTSCPPCCCQVGRVGWHVAAEATSRVPAGHGTGPPCSVPHV